MAEKVGKVEYELGVDMRKLKTGFDDAKKQAIASGKSVESSWGKGAARGIDKTTKSAQGLRGVMSSPQLKQGVMQGLGLGAGAVGALAAVKGIQMVTGAIGDSIDEAKQFEEALATVNTVAKVSDKTLAGLGDSVQDLAVKAGKQTDELTSAMYDLVSAGVDAADVMDVLEDSTTLATGALATTDEAVDLITTTLNAFNLETSDSTRVMDVWATTVANGKTTAAELAAALPQLASTAANAGLELEEVAAGFANMTAKGTPATQAATQMRGAIVALIKPNAEMAKLQQRLNGDTFEGILRNKGLKAALDAVNEAAGGNTETITKAMGRVEGYNGMLQLTGDSAAGFADNLEDMRDAAREGGVAIGMAGKRLDTYAGRQAQLAAKNEVLMQKVGAAMLGPLELLAETASAALDVLTQVTEAIGGLVEEAGKIGNPFDEVDDELDEFAERLGKFGPQFREWVAEERRLVAATDQLDDAIAGLVSDADMGERVLRDLGNAAEATGRPMSELQRELVNILIGLENVQGAAIGQEAETQRMNEALLELARTIGFYSFELGEVTEATDKAAGATLSAREQYRLFLEEFPGVALVLQEEKQAQQQAHNARTNALGSIEDLTKATGMATVSWRAMQQTLGAVEGVDTASSSLASLKTAATDADTAWKELLKRPKDNQKALRFLNREIKEWERKYKDAILNNNDTAAAAAAARLKELRGERTWRRNLRTEVATQHAAAQAEAKDERIAARQKRKDMKFLRGDLGLTKEQAKLLRDKLQEAFGPKWRTSVHVEGLTAAIKYLRTMLGLLEDIAGKTATAIINLLTGGTRKDGAKGATYYPGDYGLVGEQGPERIVNLGGITKVEPLRLVAPTPATATASSAGGQPITITIEAGAFLGSPNDAERFAQQVAPALGRELSRISLN